MSAHVLLDLLNELGGRDKVRGFAEHLIGFPNEFNKFNNIRARIQDVIYHSDTKMLFISEFCTKTSRFRL